MEMISDKNNNLDKLYYNEFSLRKTENQNERTGNRKKKKTPEKAATASQPGDCISGADIRNGCGPHRNFITGSLNFITTCFWIIRISGKWEASRLYASWRS